MNYSTEIYLGRNADRDRVWIRVEIGDGELRIHGEAVPFGRKRDGYSGSFGQISDDLPDTALGREVKAVWDRWHLNHLRAGCEHQRALGWGLGHLSVPCPECGYKYGTAWLKEELPIEVAEQVATWKSKEATS